MIYRKKHFFIKKKKKQRIATTDDSFSFLFSYILQITLEKFSFFTKK